MVTTLPAAASVKMLGVSFADGLGCASRAMHGLIHAFDPQLLDHVARRRVELELGGRSPRGDDGLPAPRGVQEVRAPRTGSNQDQVRGSRAHSFEDDAHRPAMLDGGDGRRAGFDLRPGLAGTPRHGLGGGHRRNWKPGIEARRPQVVGERRFQRLNLAGRKEIGARPRPISLAVPFKEGRIRGNHQEPRRLIRKPELGVALRELAVDAQRRHVQRGED